MPEGTHMSAEENRAQEPSRNAADGALGGGRALADRVQDLEFLTQMAAVE